MAWTRVSLAMSLLGVTAACDPHVYRASGTPVPGYGDAIRHNAAVAIIDPQPASAANTIIDMDGRRAFVAIERYRTDTVIQPVELRTSEVLPFAGSDGTGGGGDVEAQQ
jgi:hypothetical protein